MYFLIGVWSVVAILWLALVALQWQARATRIPWLVGGFAIIIAGSVLGGEFFSIDKGPIPITIDRALLAVLIAAYAGMYVRRKVSLRPLVSTDYAILFLAAVLMGSALTHDWSYANKLPLSRLLFFFLMPIALYFVVKNTEIKSVDLSFVAAGMCLFCVYLAVTAFAESRGWYGLVFPSYIRNPSLIEFLGRGRGPFLNPISNGIFLTTGLAATVLWWVAASGKTKWLVSGIIPLLLLGVICTLTRSVWLGMIVGVGLVIWIPANWRQRIALVLSAGCLGCVALMALGQSVVSFKRDKHVSVNEMSKSAQLRPIFLSIAWEMFQDRPIFGCGFGQYNRAKIPYLQDPHSNLELAKARPYLQHNVFLALLTETGLLGCGWLIVLLAKGYHVGWQLWRNPTAGYWERGFALVLIAMLSSYLVNGMFHDVFIIPMANMLLFFLLAIVTNLNQSYDAARETSESESDQWLAVKQDRLPQMPLTGVHHIGA